MLRVKSFRYYMELGVIAKKQGDKQRSEVYKRRALSVRRRVVKC